MVSRVTKKSATKKPTTPTGPKKSKTLPKTATPIQSALVSGDGTIAAIVEGRPYTIHSTHPQYAKIKEAFNAGDGATFRKFADMKAGIRDYSMGKIEVKGNRVFYNGKEIFNSITVRIIALMEQEINFDFMVKFLDNLMENPSEHSRKQLFDFLEHRDLPLTTDGCFLAYKRVRSDWKDFHTGSIDNSIGRVVEVSRDMVDDNPSSECSFGLHAGSMAYVGTFASGGHVIVIKINPRDAVSVPTHHASKMRCCRYEVVAEYKETMDGVVLHTPTGEPVVNFGTQEKKAAKRTAKKAVAKKRPARK